MKHTFIIQYFKHRDNIIPITESLINIKNVEVIFHNDSNSDHDIFNNLLNKYTNLKVINSDDIHEIRGYNKCISYAKGQYIWICQDDDIMDCKNFVDKIDFIFNKFDFLGIIGLYKGAINNWGIEENKFNKVSNNNYYINYGLEKLYMTFVSWANIGPLVIKKDLFEKIGKFDENYSDIGELGIGFDSEFTFRANLNNYRVAVLEFNEIQRGIGGHGTLSSDAKKKQRKIRCRKNRKLFYDKYTIYVDIINNIVNNLNNNILNSNIKYNK